MLIIIIQVLVDMKINYCSNIIKKEYLPRLNDSLSKLYFTGLMINKLLKCYLGIEKLVMRLIIINVLIPVVSSKEFNNSV